MAHFPRLTNNPAKRGKAFPVLVILVALILFAFLFNYADVMSDYSTNHPAGDIPIGLENGAVFKQEINAIPDQTLSAFNIGFYSFGRTNKGKLIVKLYENETVLESWDFETTALPANGMVTFALDSPHRIETESQYFVTLSGLYRGRNEIAVWINKADNTGFCYNNDYRQNETACYSLTYHTSRGKTAILVSLVASLIVLALVLFNIDEYVVMTCVLVILLMLYLTLCPPGMAPDESAHFLRCYELAHGDELFTSPIGGSELPVAIMAFSDKNAVIDWNNTSFISFPQTASYSLISYLPQTIGIKIATLFTNNVHRIYYGGKIGNALICLFLCVLALYFAPFGRKVLFVIMSFPMAMQQMVTLSPDGFTTSLSMLFLAYVLHLTYRTDRLTLKDYFILTVTGFCLAVCKTVYLALLLLLFLIPNERFSSRRQSLFYRFGFIFISTVIILLWYKSVLKYACVPSADVNSIGQIKYLLSNVSAWHKVPTRSLLQYGSFWIESMIGSTLGAMSITPPVIISIVYCIVFIYEMCSCYVNDTEIIVWDIVILLGTFFAGSALVALAMYASWTPVGSDCVEGVQGRYFLPVIALLAFSFILGRSRRLHLSNVKMYNDQYERGSFLYLLIITLNGIPLIDVARCFFPFG